MSEKEKIEENRIIPFRLEIDISSLDLNIYKENFEKQLKDVVDFEDKQTAWIYPEIEDNRLFLKAISTNKNGDKISIIDLENAFNLQK